MAHKEGKLGHENFFVCWVSRVDQSAASVGEGATQVALLWPSKVCDKPAVRELWQHRIPHSRVLSRVRQRESLRTAKRHMETAGFVEKTTWSVRTGGRKVSRYG